MTRNTIRTYPLILLALSTCLSLAVLATSTDVLRVYNNERDTNPWWLPIWPQHFDTKGLETLISISATIALLDIVAGILISKTRSASRIAAALIYTLLTISSTSLALLASLVGVIYPALLSHQSPGTDTMQSWTCRWASASAAVDGVPANFARLCRESQFAYFASIPLLLLQLSIVGMTVSSLLATKKSATGKKISFDGDREPVVTVVELPKYECRIESSDSL